MREVHEQGTVLRDEDDRGSNRSGNPHIQSMIDAHVSRRTFLSGSVVAAAGFLGGGLLGPLVGEASAQSSLGFAEVPTSLLDDIVVPPGYTWHALAPWGTPLLPGAPAFAEDASNTAAHQALQVGFNHDGIHYFPASSNGNQRGLLVMNYEYTDASQIYTAAQGSGITNDAAGREKVAKALAAHGVGVIAIQKKSDNTWEIVNGDSRNRRITGTTPMAFSGPVSASHPMLQSSVTPSPKGTLNNCAHGVTPWGTYLACEENWNGYFGTDDPTWSPTPLETRYGVTAGGFGYTWHKAEPRFDLAVNRNELNHFGWVVEIDPSNPNSVPVKRTALGRIKHEGATCTESKGRIVVYSGDDENGDYLYKFVGDKNWRHYANGKGESPLDHGTLYVAKFNENGTGTWLPLVHGRGALTTANGWIDQADVLIRTRQAADALGATRLHRPEWVAVGPKANPTPEVYVTLTNGSGNSATVNSNRSPNPYGHIIRFKEANNSDTSFKWEVFLLAGDPAHDGAVPNGQSAFGSPDGIWVDSSDIVWIQTDISNSTQNLGVYDLIGNNAMLAASPRTGEVRRFLTGPRGCEITGVIMTPDRRTMFINVQHPGESTPFWNNMNGAGNPGAPTTSNPNTVSSWPFGGRPRPTTVVIRKLDGGTIGS